MSARKYRAYGVFDATWYFEGRIEIRFRALHWRGHALIFLAQFPPSLVVVLGLDLTGEDAPAPLVDQQSEWQERDLLQRLVHEQAEVGIRAGHLTDEVDLLQVLGSDGQGNGIADGFVKTVIGTVFEQEQLLTISALVEVVSEFVVDSAEILVG